jgi:hypothetical protein
MLDDSPSIVMLVRSGVDIVDVVVVVDDDDDDDDVASTTDESGIMTSRLPGAIVNS